MEVMAAADKSPLLIAYIVVPLLILCAGSYACWVHVAFACILASSAVLCEL